MKKSLSIILLLLLSIFLIGCNKKDNKYIDNNVLINDLNNHIENVLNNEHLKTYIFNTYNKTKILKQDYNKELNKAFVALFNYEKTRLIDLYDLTNDYFNDINDINDLYPYVMFKDGDFISINYNFNHLKLEEESFNLGLIINNKYYMYNSNFEKLENDLTIDSSFISSLIKDIDKYYLYIISSAKSYKIVLREIIDNKPYIINPNVYSNFSSDVIVYLNSLQGIVTIPEGNISSDNYEIINNTIIIDKDFLIEKFKDGRESFVFGINIYYENTYYLQTIHIMSDK